jgi:hypothetical protein
MYHMVLVYTFLSVLAFREKFSSCENFSLKTSYKKTRGNKPLVFL